MRFILAGNHRIYTGFCRTYELHPYKEATFISRSHQLRGIEGELIVTCMASHQHEYYDIMDMINQRKITIVRIPCKPFCTGTWDRTTLNEIR